MAPAARRTAPERREEILRASMDLFAQHGFHGVTTRMIAQAAGVSEALLYRHFKGKDQLYAELQSWCLKESRGAAEKLAQLEPGTATLILATYFTVRQIMETVRGPRGSASIKRMMLASLLDDGEFARGFVSANFGRFVPKMAQCLEAARKAGDLADKPRHPQVRIWLMHHVAVMASNVLLPEKPVVDYGISHEVLVEEIARFALRGLGLKEAALARHFVPKTLAALTRKLIEDGSKDGSKTPPTPASAGPQGDRS